MNNHFRADLHCHTTSSDGTVTPAQIIPLAISAGLSGLSITDHDSIDAYNTALPIARQLEFRLISGVEFSAMHDNKSVHILGYSFDLLSPILLEFCQKHRQRRTLRNRAILQKLAQANMPIDEEELGDSPSVGRPHIAAAMIKRGYVQNLREAFQKYIGDGQPFYVFGGYFSVQETIDIIHEAKGYAIIAHPHLMQDENLVKKLLEMPFDGIEGYYGRFLADQQERWIKIGLKKQLLITGGSDFHGDIKPGQMLGSSWIGKETFDILETRFNENTLLA